MIGLKLIEIRTAPSVPAVLSETGVVGMPSVIVNEDCARLVGKERLKKEFLAKRFSSGCLTLFDNKSFLIVF